ncbi:ComEA family DNA-binding protein [Corynebacterium atrinae]
MDRLKELTRPTGEEELLDVAYPKPRLSMSLRQAAIAAAVVVVLVGGWVLFHGLREPEPVTAIDLPAVGPSGSTSSAEAELVVSVVGEVEHPGLVTLAPGSRIDDALLAAGPSPDADTFSLNRAQRLTDGQQIVVPKVGEPAAAGPGEGGVGGVSLNSASASELTSLPGVGAATAAAIISHRESHGGFGAVEELLDVKGIGPAKFEALKDQVTL